jgi:sialidase-1
MDPGNIVLELPPDGGGRFRSSEGSFITLRDGRVLLIYTRFIDGYKDHAKAVLASRVSSDGGRTWSDSDSIVIGLEARNVMSVSLLRLSDGRIAFLYLRKEAPEDCQIRLRFSDDEARTWTPPINPGWNVGLHVVNNDRLVQLSTGRLVIPCAYRGPRQSGDEGWVCRATFFLSDDLGATWQASRSMLSLDDPRSGSGLQEPGVFERRDGTLFGWARTDMGCQYGMNSADGGVSWEGPFPTEFVSPLSPMSVKRIPSTGDLLALWNDHSGRFPFDHTDPGRQPLASAVSRGDGRTWTHHRLIEADLSRGYHYTAIHFLDDQTVLLAYCAGLKGPGRQLDTLRVRRLTVGDFYT